MTEIEISVDVETSGPIVGRHSMLALGACVVGDTARQFSCFLKPISVEAERDAMAVVGKPLTFFVAEGTEPALACRSFADWVEDERRGARPVFVGFNAAFDWGFVNWYLLTYIGSNPFGIAPLDIKSFYAGLSGVDWEDTRSSRIPERYKTGTRHTHDALQDAMEQGRIFSRMRSEARERRCDG